jgi:hypothetical protein
VLDIRCARLVSVALASVSLALAVGACGDDNGSGTDPAGGAVDSGSATTSSAAGDAKAGRQTDGPVLSGDRREAQAGADAVGGVYENLSAAVDKGIASVEVPARETLENARDDESLAGVCDLMSEEAKRQTIVYAKRSAGLADVEWTCENATGLLLRRARSAGALKRTVGAEVVGINVDGDRATASIRFGRRISSVPLVKEDDEWKLAAAASGGGG